MIKIYCVGKIKEPWLEQLIHDQMKQIRKFRQLEIVEIKDLECPAHYSLAQQEQVKKNECELLLSKITEPSIIVLDLHGKKLSSPQFSDMIHGNEAIAFVIGGSLGLHDVIIKRAKYKVKLSDMTFTHQFARLMLLEQIAQSYTSK